MATSQKMAVSGIFLLGTLYVILFRPESISSDGVRVVGAGAAKLVVYYDVVAGMIQSLDPERHVASS